MYTGVKGIKNFLPIMSTGKKKKKPFSQDPTTPKAAELENWNPVTPTVLCSAHLER